MSGCVVCGGNEFTVHERCRQGFAVLDCRECGLLFVDPLPGELFLKNAYNRQYYRPWLGEQRKSRVRLWQKRLKTINRLCPAKGRILDVGCGEGLFLEKARENGWQVCGTELSGFAAAYITEYLGIDVCAKDITECDLEDSSFDVVTLWHVLEHTRNPCAVLKKIKKVLKIGGLLILAVPNADAAVYGWCYRLLKGRKPHCFDPEDRELHLYHFRQPTLKRLISECGFTVLETVADRGVIGFKYMMLNCLSRFISLVTGSMVEESLEVHARKC